MKGILKFAFAVCLASVAGSASVKAQTVTLNGLGSSGLFLELGLGANAPTGAINASCVWSENTNSVQANDTSTGSTLSDKGSAWVAWTTGGGTCAAPGTSSQIYAYVSTDSVVGNRCLYNANLSTGSTCSIAYPTTTPASNGIILGAANEVALPSAVATKLNSAVVNFAGTDIRPEDAEFAITRALTNCGSVVGTSTQYLGLGYTNGSAIKTGITGSTSSFNVINFALPSSFFVTPVGATPIIVAVNDAAGTGLRAASNITSQNLAFFLDGTTGTASSLPVTVYIREPLSGTYNTTEFNVPNRVGTSGGSFATSQDVGLNQPAAQRNCTVTSPWPVPATTPSTVLKNPLDFATTGGGVRLRAIGTGQELSSVVGNTSNSLGYGFWSAANFAGFSAVTSSARYYTVDGVDPLASAGVIPTTSSELASVSLSTTADGKYPIWSMLRLVNVGATQNTAVAALSSSAQTFSTSTHPDFVALDNMLVVRSHFAPPAQTLTASNGSGSSAFGSNKAAACSATETGGDVGGVVAGLNTASLSQSPLTKSEESVCTAGGTATAGQTGDRR
ncbi:hypothetical protein [Granulicella sp. S156]|jgi:hypothetical protein|uniref:hypothetical protein n=1 Tax=Granulicella sp. S156 TaxID=1747224 RepID=UPI00131B8107|nr:hypothetical protein [Granulicella sp. S156]